MTSKKKMYEAAEYYRQQWKQCYADSAATANAATARIEHLEKVVDAQKEHIVNAERRLREQEDETNAVLKVLHGLILGMESERDVAEDTAKAIQSKIDRAYKDLGITPPSSTGPDPDLS